jgi:hypothetical protein
VDLAWLKEQFEDTEIQPIMMQYAPFLLLLALQDLPKLTPAKHAEACELAFTIFTAVVQGLVAERFINVYAAGGLPCPAMRDQFAALRQRVTVHRLKASEFIGQLLEMPTAGDKVN